MPAPPERAAAELPAIPGYDLLGCLGRGGMGVVYKARQRALNRVVALKMVVAGANARAEQLARFHLEAEALASLQHPNIVQIHEVGEHDGCPYLELEFVDGPSLDRKLGGAPQPPHEAARLVRTLAEAIHHAHQRGLVHRDLKPANVLLAPNPKSESRNPKQIRNPNPESPKPAGSGVSDLGPLGLGIVSDFGIRISDFSPKVTDFGLAKRFEEDSRTETGAILGTPCYMAPEQAEGRLRDVGPAADVYALGTILYECLTGQPPFRGETVLATLEQVRLYDPVPPSRRQPRVPRDLETICLKCLHKDPRRRYATAGALAEDLRRFLAGEPITARPVGAAERAVKWARRRPAWAALVGVSAAAAVALAVLGAWSNVALRAAAGRERQARERAEKRSGLARQAVDEMYTRVAEQWLADQPHKDALQREFLDKALAIYKDLAQEEGGDPAVRRGTALAHFHVGEICRHLGERDRAREAYGRAIDMQERLHAEDRGRAEYRHDLAESYNWLGELTRLGHGPPAEAEAAYRRALALQDTLVADLPDEPAYKREQARSWMNLGIVHRNSSRPDEAAEDYARAIRILEPLTTRFPDNPECAQELARTLADRGVLNKGRGRLGEAAADYRQAIDLLEPLRDGPRSRPIYRQELATYYNNLGNLRYRQKQYEKAKDAYGKGIALLGRLVEDFPERPQYRNERANALIGRGAVLYATDKVTDAAREWGQARDLFARLWAQHPEEAEYRYRLGLALGNLGWLWLRQDDLKQARRLLEEGSGHLEAVLVPSPDNPDYLEGMRNQYRDLAEVLVRSGEHAEAAQKAAAIARTLPKPQGLLLAAGFLAQCGAAASKVPNPPPAEPGALTRRYGDQAMELLREGLRAGGVNAERLRTDSGLDPLRQREDFQSLVPGALDPRKPQGR
jgi:tetratricopeptide (TPR) repeat protein